jgi:redox-sensitive bicupin YhaK (pirin superfamily)
MRERDDMYGVRANEVRQEEPEILHHVSMKLEAAGETYALDGWPEQRALAYLVHGRIERDEQRAPPIRHLPGVPVDRAIDFGLSFRLNNQLHGEP